MSTMIIRELKPEKTEHLRAWLKKIHNSDEARDTLVEEDVTHEMHAIAEIQGKPYLISYSDNEHPQPTNMNREINKKHREIMRESFKHAPNVQQTVDVVTDINLHTQ